LVKRVSALLLLFVFMGLQGISVVADTDNVIDQPGFLNESEELELQGIIGDIEDEYNMEPVIVIVNATEGKSSMEFADDYFDYNGYGSGEEYNGILLLINMEARELWISTTGKTIISKYNLLTQTMVDRITPHLTNGDYYEACQEYLTLVGNVESSGKLDPFGKRILSMMKSPIPYIVSLVIALIATGIITFSSKGKVTTTSRTYESANSFKLTNQLDRFEREFITKRKIETKSGGGGGSHTGSSGRSHGGSGGGF